MKNTVTITLGSEEQAAAVAAVVSSKNFRGTVNEQMSLKSPEAVQMNLYAKPEIDGNDITYPGVAGAESSEEEGIFEEETSEEESE